MVPLDFSDSGHRIVGNKCFLSEVQHRPVATGKLDEEGNGRVRPTI